MDGLTRRSFLRASGVVGATALLAGAARVDLDAVLASGRRNPAAPGQPILVLLSLYGGNDGLNTLVPYADPAYHIARPDLAYRPDEVHQLDGEYGLNPGLAGLAESWRDGRLAVVRGVGYPRPDRSHFRSMDIWQTASPEHPEPSGWIGRWLDTAGDDPLLALNIGEVLPPLAVGTRATAAALTPGRDGAREAAAVAGVAPYAVADPSDSPAARMVVDSYAGLQRCEQLLRPLAADPDPDPPEGDSAGNGNRSGLGAQLALVSRCIRADVPTRVYAVSASGFDTHANEKATQTALLTSVDKALTAFRSSLADSPRAGDVVLMAYSEFGRRVRANASQGTDHGTSGPVFLLGDRVRPGYYGDQPPLTDLVDDDLRTTTDFRAVYGEVLDTVLAADPARILDTVPPALGVLA